MMRYAAALFLILASVVLLALQVVTLAKFIVWPPSISFASFEAFSQTVASDIQFTVFDVVLLSTFLFLVVLLLALEWWRGALTDLVAHILHDDKRALLFFMLSSFVLLRYYLAPGKPNWAADGSIHIVHGLLTAKALALGEWPIYTFQIGSGSPYLLFYGCLFFYVVGLVDLFLQDFYFSFKSLLFFAHFFSGVGMYLWLRTLARSRAAGIVAGWVYIMVVWHPQQILYMGGYPLSLVYALLPWPFFFFEALLSGRLRVSVAVSMAALTLGLLGLNHPGYASVGTALFGLYCTVRIASGNGGVVKSAALMLVGGLAIGSYTTLGLFLESSQATLFDALGNADNNPTWRHLLYWSNIRYRLSDQQLPHWYGAYVGLSTVLLVVMGLLRRPSRIWAIWVNLAVCITLVFGPDISNIFRAPLEPHRHLLFAVFFLSAAAGWGSRVAFCLARRRSILTLICIVLLVDLGSTTFQHPFASHQTTGTGYPRSLYEPMKREADTFLQGEIPNYRIMWATGVLHGFLALGEALFFTSTPITSSIHDLPASRMVESVRELITHEVNQSTYDQFENVARYELLLKCMYLLNVRYLLYTNEGGDSTEQLELMRRSPVVVSNNLSALAPDEQMQFQNQFLSPSSSIHTRTAQLSGLVSAMDIDIERGSSRQIFVLDAKDAAHLAANPQVSVQKHVVRNEAVELHISMSDSGFVRLSYAYFPGLRVTVNGREVNPIVTQFNFMALPIGAGSHTISIEPRLSRLRTILLLLGCLSVALGMLWIYMSRPSRTP